jgi:hypothetical protein
VWLAQQPKNKCNDGCAGGSDLDFFRHGLKRDRSDVARLASRLFAGYARKTEQPAYFIDILRYLVFLARFLTTESPW